MNAVWLVTWFDEDSQLQMVDEFDTKEQAIEAIEESLRRDDYFSYGSESLKLIKGEEIPIKLSVALEEEE